MKLLADVDKHDVSVVFHSLHQAENTGEPGEHNLLYYKHELTKYYDDLTTAPNHSLGGLGEKLV